jgi:3-phenylpropionate/trans-cinnamate dioxygenase ferredoxin reductase subunit
LISGVIRAFVNAPAPAGEPNWSPLRAMSRKLVVIGAGQAAAAFAAKLRESDRDSSLVILGAEGVAPYQRPPLSKKYMTGEMEFDRLLLRPLEWYREHDIDLRVSQSAESIDRDSRTVRTADGDTLPYDALLLATGATPRRLPAEMGGNLEGVHVLRGLADADALSALMQQGRRLLVVGGGYIGLEAAAVAATRGLSVTVAEMAPRILQRVASPQTAQWFRDTHERHGVTILEGVKLEELEARDGRVCGARFADGKRIDADFVLVGIGVTPNDALARNCGLSIENGIAVDTGCRTSDPAILAAGDCASFPWRGSRIRLESVQNAIEQAEAAARSLCGEHASYDPVPWFWSDQYDVKLQIAGLNSGYDETVVRPGSRESTQSVWYFRAGQFVAVDAMNDPRACMFGKRILETGRTLTPAQAADPAFDLKALISA